MPRLATHFASAFAALIITIASLQAVTNVPSAQQSVVEAPTLA